MPLGGCAAGAAPTWVFVPWWFVEVPRQQLPLHGASGEVAAVQAVRVEAEAAAGEVVACREGAGAPHIACDSNT